MLDRGYYDNTDKQYYFYQTDHLGNNRVVANQGGTPIQKNHYYPFGMAFAEGTTQEQGKQPYKYNGKELDQLHGLNLYDYSARYYEPAIGRFTTVDPLAEKYYSISPYAYCNNNPLRFIDPDGRAPQDGWPDDLLRAINETGNIIASVTGMKDAFIVVTGLLEPISGKPAATFNFKPTGGLEFRQVSSNEVNDARESLCCLVK